MEKENALTTIKQRDSFSVETIETVKRSIFPKSTDDELKLFIHKCLTVGVHPLDKLLTPIKYNTKNGTVVSFISSIDLFRSKAEDSGKYDGQDEPVFEYDDGENEPPTKCTLNVYKKDIGRPFVGIAHMKEFLPNQENKRQFWNQMPHVMLAKCAEAQAFRKAFPQELNKLYVEEEMYNAIHKASGGSSKPEITQQTTERITTTSASGTERIKPTEQERQDKKLISEKQGYFLIAQIKENKASEAAILNLLKIPSIFFVTWNNRDKYCMDKLLKTIKEKPEFFNKYEPKVEQVKTQEEPPAAYDEAEYLEILRATAHAAGCPDDASINQRLLVNFPKIVSIDKIDVDSQQLVLDYFIALKDNPEQA